MPSFASVLAETDRYIMNAKDGILYINLHFDSHTEYASLISDRGDNAVLRLTLKRQMPVYIRLPSWSQSVNINAQDKPVPFSVENGYVAIKTSDIKTDTVIEIIYDLPEQITVEKAWRSGIAYEIHWKGNDITDVIIK
jgi:DUF1680 family protein